MNIDDNPEAVTEILNQINLSLLSKISDISKKDSKMENRDIYLFEILCPKQVDTISRFAFEIEISKDKSSIFGFDTSTYKTKVVVKKGNSYSYSEVDSFEIKSTKHVKLLKSIFNIVNVEYLKRESIRKSEKMYGYIEMIKETVDPAINREKSIDDVLN